MQATMDSARAEKWLSLGAVGACPSVSRAEGTCQWLVRHPTYRQWASSGCEDRPLLWIHGHQGSGKSVLAGYLQELLVAEGSNTLFYRFQRSASTTLSTPTTFASSLIWQILANPKWRPSAAGVCQQLQYLAAQFPLGPQHCAFKTIWSVAVSLLKTCRAQFTIILDALDECRFDGPPLPGTTEFVNSLRETGCKFAIFTRPEPLFVATIQHGLSIFMAEALLLPDIMTFARTSYQQLKLPDTQVEQVLEIFSSSSHGSFRWVDLSLRHLARSIPATDLASKIQTLPPTIGDLYRQSLRSNGRTLSYDELECRKGLLLMILQSQRPLRTAEIADALSLQPEGADILISRLCSPLASTFGGFFHLSHPSVREFFELLQKKNDRTLGISFSKSHDFLAEQCLSCLLGKEYGGLRRIGSYVLASYDENACIGTDAKPREGSFYDYASRFWDYHLAQTKTPSNHLLQQATTFLLSPQFAYWSEVTRQNCGQLVRVNGALTSLSTWRKSLPWESQRLLRLDEYFEKPYTSLAAALESSELERSLAWLARMSLGDFYFIRNLSDKVASTRGKVLAGLEQCLGPQHPLTLTAKSGVAYGRLYAGRMRAANRMYNEIVTKQGEIVGERSSHFLDAVLYQGQSEFYMANFATAAITMTKHSADCLTAMGPESWRYLAARWWFAQSAAYMDGQLELALQIFQFIVQKRRELFSRGDSFALVTLITLGEVQLLLGRHEEAISALEEATAWRREVYAPTNVARIDTELALATAYRAAGRAQAASKLAREMEDGAGDIRSRFERYCQLCHLKGLILADAGSVDKAINLLQDTITRAEDDQNNRALLWIRLDIAILLRRRDRDGDRDQANANFDNLVKDVSGDYDPGFPDEPDPPRLLEAAEKALILVRARKHLEARRLLDAEQLEWRRSSDFWLWVGGTFCKDLLHLEAGT
ncbi:hypothetical protein B0H67DRAFT_588480 [Lasiosphaeris hirsuta]|uniref:Nephrocystin 3-like N-terminal domain-containing protein n=1 Tax=Lasiosphaeris hirsuta TaxID=260670 RepID=A0AA40A218_9PEZI|nr:hypothetical protein B0H67DRAFT_588480 [Lasiosphaeris hirsuta]